MVRITTSTRHHHPLKKHSATKWIYLLAIIITIIGLGALIGTHYYIFSWSSQKKNTLRSMVAMAALSGNKPYLLYGTAWKKQETARLVCEAIESGFRFVDTACQPKHYNEAGVGVGWRTASDKLGLRRSDLFLQTKFTSLSGQDPNNIPYDRHASLETQVIQSLQKSLSNLSTSYIDSLVLHSPMDTIEQTMQVWRVFETFVDDGTVLKLGISNCYDLHVFTTLYQQARIKPWVLQNRFYAESGFDVDLRDFCKKHDIVYQSFWTLSANRHALARSEVKQLADQKHLTPQTLLYAYMMTLGHTPLSGTTDKTHMAQDVAVMERIQGGEQIFNDDELTSFSQILGIPSPL